MTIRDKLLDGGSVAEGRRALELFTDRSELLRLYASYLSDEPPPDKLIYLQGDGGNGKSLLLRYLKERCSNRLTPSALQEMQSLAGGAFAAKLIDYESAAPIPTALLDFSLAPHGPDNPQDVFSALLIMRRALTADWLRFPLFDYACVLHLHKTGRLLDENLRMLFPGEEMDFITEIASEILQSKWFALANAILKLFGKHMRRQFTLYRMHRKLDKGTVSEINELAPHSQLLDELPLLFAKDLNAALAPHAGAKRVALFFDSHESFWGDQHDFSEDLFHERDEWLRYLIEGLELKSGITVVVAGRDTPRWHEAGKHPIQTERVDLRHVGGLPGPDAADFLTRAGVEEDGLRQSLIDYARVAPGESHPFMLALSADVVRAAAAQGTRLRPEDFLASAELGQKQKALLDRLLRYVNSEVAFAVRALSAARAFNLDVYLALGQALHFQATQPSFDALTRLSFVWQADRRGHGWHQIHEVVRRLLGDRNDDVALRAHQALEEYYRARSAGGEITELAEAIYHAGHLDWQRAVEEWAGVFERVVSGGRFDECRVLLELRNELRVESTYWRMVVARLEGEYFENLARWDEAIQAYTTSLKESNALIQQEPGNFAGLHAKALLLQKLGFISSVRSEHEQALENYRQALEYCERAARIAPESVDVWNTLGTTHIRIGEHQEHLAQHKQACESYQRAVAAFDQAIPSIPETIQPRANKASALTLLGDLQIKTSDYKNARASLEMALRLYEELLTAHPDLVSLYGNRGITYTHLGRLLAAGSDWEDSIKAYQEALASYDVIIPRFPGMPHPYNNKASVTVSLGEALAAAGRFEEAIERYLEAVCSCDEAIERAPRLSSAHNTRGLALTRLGQARTKLSNYEDALTTFDEAFLSFDEALRHSPKMASALANKGTAFWAAGNTLQALSRYDAAGDRYGKAVQCLDESLQHAPDFINAHGGRALALVGVGDIQTRRGDYQLALYAYREALAAHGRASAAAPEDFTLKGQRAEILSKIGLRLMDLRIMTEAYDNLSSALHLADQVVRRDPGAAAAHNDRGMILTHLGLLSYLVKDYERALDFYRDAIAAHREFKKLAPDDLLPHNNLANTLIRLGEAQAQVERFDDAAASYNSAVAECDRALERSPDYPFAHSNKALAFLRLAQLQEATGQAEAAINALQESHAAICKALAISPNEPEFNLTLQMIDDLLGRVSGPVPA